MSNEDGITHVTEDQLPQEHKKMLNEFLNQHARARAIGQRIQKRGTMATSIRSKKRK